MSYNDIADMAVNAQLQNRVIACAAVEGEPNPVSWLSSNMWAIAASPGWGDAWEYGLATGIPPEEIGANEAVISDAMILAAVQVVRSE
jgi:hypothetical protein